MSESNVKGVKTELIVQLTDKYRIISDGMQYIVQELVTVDPSLAPNWTSRIAEAKAEGKPMPDATIRYEWRNVEAPYYSLRDSGLIAAINSVKHRTAIETLGHVSLTEFTDFLREQNDRMTSLVVGK